MVSPKYVSSQYSPDCVGVIDVQNKEYIDFSCVYSLLEPFYFGWERKYDINTVLNWMLERPYFPIKAVLLYGVCIILGQRYMKNRPSWNWRKALGHWNLFLSFFSWIGTIRTVPNLYHYLMYAPLRESFCGVPEITYGSGSTGLWVQLFILSKFPELLDTVFIIIHKKPLIFLHWYHHITVLLYCWHSYVTRAPYGLFFICMNYFVHACMYGYYYLMAIKCKPKWLNPMFITTLQILQMVIGVIVSLVAFYFYSTNNNETTTTTTKAMNGQCMIQRENIIAAFIMYGSYLFLFSQFFIMRYMKKAAAAGRKNAVVVSSEENNKKLMPNNGTNGHHHYNDKMMNGNGHVTYNNGTKKNS